MPPGVKVLKLLILWGSVGVFIGLWLWFFNDIWTIDKQPVSLNQKALYVASAIGGVLGTFFAVSMGVERRDPQKNAMKLAPGSTLLGTPSPQEKGISDSLATVAVWGYGLVGIGAVITLFVHSAESPGAVETLATVFGGYLLAIITAAFKPGQA